jgi:murein tripeptide amidase MpaA
MEGEVSPRSGVGSFFILEANQKTALPFVQETQPVIDRAVSAAQDATTFVGSDDGQVQMMLAERITAFNEEMGRRHEAQVRTREILDDTRDIYISTLVLGGPGVALNAIVELVATTTEIYQQVNFTGKNLTAQQDLLCDSQQALFPEGGSIIGTCSEETSQTGNLVLVAAYNQPQLQDSELEITSAEALIADFNNLHRAILTDELDASELLLEKFAVSEEKFSQLIQERLLTLSDTGNDSEQFTLLSANVFEYELAMLNYYAALGFRYLAPDDEQVAAQLATAGANVAAKVDQYAQTADLKLSVAIAAAPGPQADADVPLSASAPIRSSAVAWWHWALLGVGVLITITWLMISIPNIPIPAAVQVAIGEHQTRMQFVLSVVIVIVGTGLLWNSRNPQVEPPPGPTTNQISDVQMTPTITITPTVANAQPSSTIAATSTVFPNPTLKLSPTFSPTILSTATPPQTTPTPTIPVSLFEKQTIGTSVQGNPIERYQFGNGEYTVIFVGGIHSGFAPSSTILAERLVDYFSTNNQDLPENITMYIIPNLNPDSLAAPGQLAGRLNGNNVDLNRNWDCRWAADSAVLGNVIPAVGGASPLSEPETQSLADFLLDVQPDAVVFWEARARDGLVTPGNCGARHTPSEALATIYGQAAGYRIIDFASLTQDDLTGDVSNWLATMNIPSIFVLQPSYEAVDWQSNLNGILAILNSLD